MKIRPTGAKLSHAVGRKEGRTDEANSRLSKFCEGV